MIGKAKLNSIEVLIVKDLIDSIIIISHKKFVSLNNMLKEYYGMKKEIKSLMT